MNPIEILKFVESAVKGQEQQLNAMALLADAPNEDYMASIRLPVQNEIPAFRLGTNNLGSSLVNIDHGVAAPVLGQESTTSKSIGELLTGEIDGTF